jgi:hypothetical protein
MKLYEIFDPKYKSPSVPSISPDRLSKATLFRLANLVKNGLPPGQNLDEYLNNIFASVEGTSPRAAEETFMTILQSVGFVKVASLADKLFGIDLYTKISNRLEKLQAKR